MLRRRCLSPVRGWRRRLHTPSVSDADLSSFRRDGFVVFPRLICPSSAASLAARMDALFAGQFDRGVYPDEWYGRTGMSLPHATREMNNAWKSDRAVASLVLSAGVGQLAARLMPGWGGARVAQDSVIDKPPGGTPVHFHTDEAYISRQFLPREDNSVTVWVALDDADEGNGALEYAPGSHAWEALEGEGEEASFHGTEGEGYRERALREMRRRGAGAGLALARVPAGGCVVHHQRTLHGSGPNASATRSRRAIAVHLLRDDVRFAPRRASYIYGRYQLRGSDELHEDFFPVTYRHDGYRSEAAAEALGEACGELVCAACTVTT